VNRLSRRRAELSLFCGFFMSAQQATFKARFIFSRHHNILSAIKRYRKQEKRISEEFEK